MLDLASTPSLAAVSEDAEVAAPKAGRSLGARVAVTSAPIRAAVHTLSSASPHGEVVDLMLKSTRLGPGASEEPPALRSAWLIVASALLHARATNARWVSSLESSLAWFIGDSGLAAEVSRHYGEVWSEAERELAALLCDAELWTLLPYVLEPDGHVTRTEFETCSESKARKAKKRSEGAFYTAGDVASFMANTVYRPASTWLDPACGTGVFLRAAIHVVRQRERHTDVLEFARSSLFAIDKSSLATDLAAVVVIEQFVGRQLPCSPADLWAAIKENIVCADAQRLRKHVGASDLFSEPRDDALEHLFGHRCANGFDLVIMNPPYARTTVHGSVYEHWNVMPLQTSHIETHVLFTEMMWRFTNSRGAAVAVLPLSVGANTSKAYIALRTEIAKVSGKKVFLFFDREPQALFGEDIKTRNTILYVDKSSPRQCIYTSGLLKWTAEQRSSVLTAGRAVALGKTGIEDFVPKLSCEAERATYDSLRKLRTEDRPRITRISLAEICGQELGADVFVSATAYNFINAFKSDGVPITDRPSLSASPLLRLSFANEKLSFAALAILGSRLMFWLWHVECDGFHVSSEFIKRSPLWSVFKDHASVQSLSSLGEQHWGEVRRMIVRSVNGGKCTYSFHAGYNSSFYSKVDRLILRSLGLDECTKFLDQFVADTVHVGGVRRDRSL